MIKSSRGCAVPNEGEKGGGRKFFINSRDEGRKRALLHEKELERKGVLILKCLEEKG